jgi:2,3-bisphosphoglycerate-dependent phosphoglycerate mutase
MKSEQASLQHRPFLIPLWLTAIAVFGAFAVFSVAVLTGWAFLTANSTTIIVIRHAEKDTVNSADPALSAAGEARAAQLARMFGEPQTVGRLDAIYVSATLRSRLTAAPVGKRLGIVPIVAGADDPNGLARRVLRENRGKRVMVIGHLNTVPGIVASLSGRSDIPAIDEQDFATMYVVTVPRIGRANLLRLNY